MRCPQHIQYVAKLKPRHNCLHCWSMWLAKKKVEKLERNQLLNMAAEAEEKIPYHELEEYARINR